MSEPKYTCVSMVCNGESLVSHSEVKTFRGIFNHEEISAYWIIFCFANREEICQANASLTKTVLCFSCHSSGDQDNFLPVKVVA